MIGAPHADFGEGVMAVVVRAPGSTPEPAAITRALATRLAAFKRPGRVVIVDERPRNAMGKVQKAALSAAHKDMFAAASA